MRKWGVLITGFYALVLLFLLEPAIVVLIQPSEGLVWGELPWWFAERFWVLILWAMLLIAGQALLLFVSVDTSFRRIQQRRHIGVAIATVALMVGLLSGLAIWSAIVAVGGDQMLTADEHTWGIGFWVLVAFSWLAWGTVFYFYKAGASDKLERMIGWLIKGSVLELLIAVPSHVIVRHREDCSAPFITGYGIATGIAVMLMAFGPSVLFLYQKRLAEYESRPKKADL